MEISKHIKDLNIGGGSLKKIIVFVIQYSRKKMLPSCIYGIAIFLSVTIAACENSEQEIKAFTEKKIGVDEAGAIETFFSQAGIMKAKLTAPVMFRYQDTLPRVEFPQSLHVDFYNDSLQTESNLDALYGRYIEGQKKMFLRDSVVVVQRFNQDTLRCQELWWDQNKEIFYTDKPIRITKKDGTVLPGQGLEASQDFRNIKIISPSQGILPVSESEFSGASAPDSTRTDGDDAGGRNRLPGTLDTLPPIPQQ